MIAGVDLSTKAIDIALLDDEGNRARWVHLPIRDRRGAFEWELDDALAASDALDRRAAGWKGEPMRYAMNHPEDWEDRMDYWMSAEPEIPLPPLERPAGFPVEVPCENCGFPLYKAKPGMVCSMCGKTVSRPSRES